MTRRRSRIRDSRLARQSKSDGFDPSSFMRLAGFVAMVLVALAVAAGFQGDRLALVAAERLSGLSPLVEPGLFGVSVIEWMVIAALAIIVTLVLWRGFRR